MSDVDRPFNMKNLGEAAVVLNELHGKLVGFRILLQPPLDILSKLLNPSPASGSYWANELARIRFDLTETMAHLLELSGHEKVNYYDSNDIVCVKKEYEREITSVLEWSSINSELMGRKSQWKEITCKWHRRLSSQQSRAKSFNRSLWDQFKDVHDSVGSSQYESQNCSRWSGDEGRIKNIFAQKFCDGSPFRRFSSDENERNDRKFYFTLLKRFVSNDNSSDQTKTLESWGTDVRALRNLKRKNVEVDARASKGRKLRYSFHPMLRNFMFPSDISEARKVMDDLLVSSLFQ